MKACHVPLAALAATLSLAGIGDAASKDGSSARPRTIVLAATQCELPESGVLRRYPRSKYPNRRLSWWLTKLYTPTLDTLFGMPVSKIKADWSRALLLTDSIVPPEDPAGLLPEHFAVTGDFNADGVQDRAVVGVYETDECDFGRFLLVLTNRLDEWTIAGIVAVPGEPGFSQVRYAASHLSWWFCHLCDTAMPVVWDGTQYVIKR